LAQDIGKPYIDFNAVTANGTAFKFSDLSGKVIFLDFWASWCKPCKEEFPYLIKLYSDLNDSSFMVVAVNVDNDKEKLNNFISNLGTDVPFTVIFDKEGKLPELYKLDVMPTSFIIDKKGVIKFKHTGFELSDKETYKKEINELLSAN
jgi:thiol-disulfide isomerase/thioredoxin